jgi:hypothetical protein
MGSGYGRGAPVSTEAVSAPEPMSMFGAQGVFGCRRDRTDCWWVGQRPGRTVVQPTSVSPRYRNLQMIALGKFMHLFE